MLPEGSGKDMKKKVLFVCVENACRSQMAEAISSDIASDAIEASSAGSKPAGQVNPKAVKVMAEKGIDISGNKPKGFDDLDNKKFDYAITLGCKDTCPFISADKHIEWQIEDPKDKDVDFFRKTRDSMYNKINLLAEDIKAGNLD
jgi:protein-tyrosine-phosphatase